MTQDNRWIAAIWAGIIVVTVVLVYVVPTRGSKMGVGLGTQVENAIVGTSAHFPRPDQSSNDGTVRALEQATGVKNERALIGKRISVMATPEQVSGTTFWANVGGNAQVLVAMSRDRRNADEKYLSEVAPTDLETTPNQPVEVSGTIQRIPGPGERFTWGDNDGTHGPLSATVYLQADRVASPQP